MTTVGISLLFISFRNGGINSQAFIQLQILLAGKAGRMFPLPPVKNARTARKFLSSCFHFISVLILVYLHQLRLGLSHRNCLLHLLQVKNQSNECRIINYLSLHNMNFFCLEIVLLGFTCTPSINILITTICQRQCMTGLCNIIKYRTRNTILWSYLIRI